MTFNKPWLDQAIARGDDIILATPPSKNFLEIGNGARTGFGREINYLIDNGYQYDEVAKKMIKR